MEILKAEKPENDIEYLDTFELLGSQHQWTTEPSETNQMTILKTEVIKPENYISKFITWNY